MKILGTVWYWGKPSNTCFWKMDAQGFWYPVQDENDWVYEKRPNTTLRPIRGIYGVSLGPYIFIGIITFGKAMKGSE